MLPMRVYARIDLDALMHNMEVMHRMAPDPVRMCVVVKADGYGHGALPVAKTIQELPYVWGFATATVAEAVRLRHGGINKPILVLGYCFEDNDEDILRYDIRPALFTWEMAQRLDRLAGEADGRIHVHLAVDTGMTRIGMSDSAESAGLALRIAQLPNLDVEGIFTHFARADETDKSCVKQAYGRFRSFCEKLEERGLHIPIRHCSNSACIIDYAAAHMDMVRAGITTYGIRPSDELEEAAADLRPLMELHSHISYIKTVPAGVPVSYGGTYVTERTTRIATVPVGYADGYPRSLSSRGYVLIRGQRAPVIGRVCMDQFMVDVTEIEGLDADAPEEVILMGRDGEEEITVDELGRLSGRFPYEFVCCVARRVPRVYVRGGAVLDEPGT